MKRLGDYMGVSMKLWVTIWVTPQNYDDCMGDYMGDSMKLLVAIWVTP